MHTGLQEAADRKAGRAIVFWYDLASPYSYLSAMRIEDEAARAGLAVRWQPFLLGPIFSAQGWATSPFNVYPAKGRYMIRDMQRLCAARGLDFHMPEGFPLHSVTAARLAWLGAETGWIAPFTKAVFRAEFGQGRDISSRVVLDDVLSSLGLDSASLLRRCEDEDVRLPLRRATEAAARAGIFGAPSFQTSDGELFWGDDRLIQAVDWAAAL